MDLAGDQLGHAQAIEVNGGQRVLYCAGQASVDAEGRAVFAGDMRAHLNHALDNLETVLGEAGYRFADVVRLNYYTTDVDQLFEHWDIMMRRVAHAGSRPSGTLLGVPRLAYPQLLIEIEATAMC